MLLICRAGRTVQRICGPKHSDTAAKQAEAFFLSCVLIVVIFVFISFLLSGLSLRDTYWVIRGLLLCEMTSTVKGTLENFFSLVETYGFVPNGARIYYERRSQPPFLTLMVREYYRATG